VPAKDLFLAALNRPPSERPAFLAEACGGDAALRADIESLLAFHDEEASGGGTSHTPRPPTEMFAPGQLFAGRYRMVTRIGRGGMGDVWRADDLVLDTPVALKVIHATSAEGRARILNEVRLARQITHPAVCRVFDVGEAEDEVFFTMELVAGEDLARLLKRAGRLPPERVIDIGRQLCAGLSAAHAQGVLHRDLKPANVLIDEDGQVRITDFGIAVTSADTGEYSMVGTPGYMAPEQLAGTSLSDRTDLYALGVLLYELVVGQHPFTAAGLSRHPPRPSTLVADVDPELERVILQAILPDPRDRPASAAAMAAAFSEEVARRAADAGWARTTRSLRWWGIGLALAAGVVAAAVMWPGPFSGDARGLTDQDTIVVSDFMNATGEPVFDGTLKVALAVALEQSPFLKVFGDERVRQTLRLMRRSPDEPVTPSIAREIAQRERLKALLSGSIASLGQNYVLTLEAVNAQTGDVMAREQVEATSKEQVLTSLGRAASKMREKLGESLASIQKFDVALPKATTPSLEALHAYALGLDQDRLVARLGAVPHLQRAIELDPDFALAQALLSGLYANTGRSALAPALSRRAFELRDRVSERERFFISWRYYHDATQDWDKAFDLARSWTTAYPREPFAFSSLGVALSFFGQHEQAIASYREAIRLDPMFIAAYENLAAAYIALNQFEDAKDIVKQASVLRPDLISLRRFAYVVAFIAGDPAAMAREGAAAREMDAASVALWEARVSVFGGDVQRAHAQFRAAIALELQAGLHEMAAQSAVEDAEAHALVEQCAEARSEITAALDLSRDNFTVERAARALALCGGRDEVSALSAELIERFPAATQTIKVRVPIVTAALAIQQRDAARAMRLLDPVTRYDHARGAEFWPLYLRGQAQLQAGNGRDASVQFQSIIDHRGEAPDSPLFPLAHLGLGRAATLNGNGAARKHYETFFKIWSGAAPGMRLLQEARREYAQLR
jgi:tetratricopeptide (TPR) repeat protein